MDVPFNSMTFGLLTTRPARLFAFLELGMAIPRSGGEKVYVCHIADEPMSSYPVLESKRISR